MQLRFRFRRVVVITTAVMAALAVGGCGDLIKQPYPAKSYFAIEPGTPPPGILSPTTRPTSRPVILVRAVRVSPPYDGLGFVYQTGPAQYTTDYYDNWIAAPSAQFTGTLADWLDDIGSLTVVVPGSSVRSNYVLDSEVTRLMVDRTTPAHPRVLLVTRFFLTRADTGGVVSDKSYSASMDASASTAAAYAVAWGQAYRDVLGRLTFDLTAAIASKP